MSENTQAGTGPEHSSGDEERSTLADVSEQEWESGSESNEGDWDEMVPLDHPSERYEIWLTQLRPLTSDTIDQEDLYLVALSRHYRFKDTGRLSDIDRAIEYGTRAVDLTPDGHSELPERLTGLGVLYTDRYQHLGRGQDLEKALECDSRALELTPDGHPDLPRRFANLGVSYGDRYQLLGEVGDLDKSLEYESRALELTPDGHPDLPGRFANLGVSYGDRYRLLGEVGDLNKSLEYKSRALELTPDDHPDLPDRFANLSASYTDRYRLLGEVGDLNKSLEYDSRALELTPDGHSDLPGRFANLGVSYGDRYRLLGGVGDLDKSLEYKSRALELTPDGHSDLPGRFANLGVSYGDRYRLLGGVGDLDKSLEYKSRALELTPDGHPDLPGRFASLGVSYTDRYRLLGEVGDLNKSLEYKSRALELTPDGHPDLPGRFEDLGVSYGDRYRLLGEVGDLDKSLEYKSRALELTPDGHPDLPGRFENLGVPYTYRYRLLGEVGDLNKSLEYDSRALELTPDGHPDLPGRFANLSASYTDRYRLLGEVGDLDKSLEYDSRALELTPEGHPELPGRFANLGLSYGDRYRLLGGVGDLDKSLEYKSRALELTPDGHPDLPGRFTSLSVSYTDRYRLLREVGDLDKSLEYQSRALALTPDAHPDLSTRHYNQALNYIHQYRHTGRLPHLDSSLDSFRKATNSVTSPPRDRFQYALAWAGQASGYAFLNPIEAYQATIDLLPQYIWLGATTTQRYQDLSLAENLAVRAASAAILGSDHKLALEWLEHARCVVWNQSVMLRSPLDLLESSYPELAIRLQTAAEQLHRASFIPSGLPAPGARSDVLENRHLLAREYNDLLAHARQLPGFEDLLRPTKANALVRVAHHGPIVVLNCHEDRCDALIILPETDAVRHLSLPSFTAEMAQHARSEIEVSLRRKGLRERGVKVLQGPGPQHLPSIEQALVTIWTGIVKPVLDFLGYTNHAASDTLPHVTWCPTGALTSLPLHAAGDYCRPCTRAFDHVISSYIPTLTALRASTPHTLTRDSGMIAIGQQATRGHTLLPGTAKELAYVAGHVGNKAKYSQLIDHHATPTAVLDAMQEHAWVHLACHAHQNISDPTKSGFFLHNGTLDLAAINGRSFKNKGLAFLSACQTAMGDEKLPDEAIHLASGMLMAGYPSVIATMWSVNDGDAPLVADKVYAQLMQDGKVGNGEAGRALHNAVAALREKVGEKEFGRWVPYIHIGS